MQYQFLVGYAVERPPSPANTRYSCVLVEADNEIEGSLLALQMVGSRDGVVMPVSLDVAP
jgi:hypothetical protein